jgi:hypothetical protein
MNFVASFVANSEASELMEPSDRSFHDPTSFPESTTMFRIPTSQARGNATATKFVAVRLRVVTAVSLDALGAMTGSADLAADRRNGFHQRQKLCHVVSVCTSKRGCQWNARRIRNDVVLATRFAAIRRVGTGFGPPSTARMLELSTTARDQSTRSAALSSASNTSWRRFQTPASCQSRNRRQQVIPHPQPNSCGNIVQGIPLRKTNKIPVSASRLPTGGRPPLDDVAVGGNKVSTRFHKSSATNGLAMTVLLDQSLDLQTISR